MRSRSVLGVSLLAFGASLVFLFSGSWETRKANFPASVACVIVCMLGGAVSRSLMALEARLRQMEERASELKRSLDALGQSRDAGPAE